MTSWRSWGGSPVILAEMDEAEAPHPCPCCGSEIQTVRGRLTVRAPLLRRKRLIALYWAEWRDGHPREEIRLEIGVGGEPGKEASVRFRVPITCQLLGDNYGFGLIDAPSDVADAPDNSSEGRRLYRSQARIHPDLPLIWKLAEAIVEQDTRVIAALERAAAAPDEEPRP